MTRPALEPPAYCSIKTVARLLDTSETTVRELVKRGELPAAVCYLGTSPRWKWSEIEARLDGPSQGKVEDHDPIMGAVHGA